MLVLVSLAVLAVVIVGTAVAMISAQRWSLTYTADASEQSSEDAASLMWMGDVGTASAVIPAAVPGTTAEESVRFDSVTRSAGWPAAAQCRAVTWQLERTTADPSSPSARDSDGELKDVAVAHREVAYYADVDGARCDTTTDPVVRTVSSTPVRHADPAAQFTYRNGHLRDLVFPDPAQPSDEACADVPAGDEVALDECIEQSQTDIAAQRTPWEWADPEPVQVLLEMTTDQAGSGEGYATQVGWREVAGRRELTGDPTAPAGTLTNVVGPAGTSMSPLAAAVVVTADDPAQDFLTVTRTDLRAMDGFEVRCQESLAGTPTSRTLGPVTLPTGTPQPETVPGSLPGHTYTCAQQGWVVAVAPPLTGQRYPDGETGWSPESPEVTRRPLAPVFTPATQLDDPVGAPADVFLDWSPVTGAATYDVQYRVNGAATWQSVAGPFTADQWQSPPIAGDTRWEARVRAVNAGGVSPWTATTFDVPLDQPATLNVSRSGATFTATWPAVADYSAARHSYEVRYRPIADPLWSPSVFTDTRSSTGTVEVGDTVRIEVRAVGANTPPGAWRSVDYTRTLSAPSALTVTLTPAAYGLTSSVNAATCEAGTTVEYNVRYAVESWSGWVQYPWRGWSTDRTAFHAGAIGRDIESVWMARCVAPSGEATEGPEYSRTREVTLLAPTNLDPGFVSISLNPSYYTFALYWDAVPSATHYQVSYNYWDTAAGTWSSTAWYGTTPEILDMSSPGGSSTGDGYNVWVPSTTRPGVYNVPVPSHIPSLRFTVQAIRGSFVSPYTSVTHAW